MNPAETALRERTHAAVETAAYLANEGTKTGHTFVYELDDKRGGAYVFYSRDPAKGRRIIAAMMKAFNEEYP